MFRTQEKTASVSVALLLGLVHAVLRLCVDQIKELQETKRRLSKEPGGEGSSGQLPSSQSVLALAAPLSECLDWLVALLRDEEVAL